MSKCILLCDRILLSYGGRGGGGGGGVVVADLKPKDETRGRKAVGWGRVIGNILQFQTVTILQRVQGGGRCGSWGEVVVKMQIIV